MGNILSEEQVDALNFADSDWLEFTDEEVIFVNSNNERCGNCVHYLFFHEYIEQGENKQCRVCNKICLVESLEIKDILEVSNGKET